MRSCANALLAVLALACLAGCLSFDQPALDRRLFTVDPVRTGRDAAPGPWADQGLSLRVRPFSVSTPYADRTFSYRIGESEFQTDFYNAFAADPADLFMEQAVEWLSQSRVFSRVTPDDVDVPATHALRGRIVELYGDYAEPESPRAVVSLRFILTDERSVGSSVVLDALIRRSAPVEGDGPSALAAAFSNAYAQVLAELEERLRRTTPSSV